MGSIIKKKYGNVYNNKQPSGHGMEMDHTNGNLNV